AAGQVADQVQPTLPALAQTLARPRPQVGAAERHVDVAAEEDRRFLDVAGPVAEELYVAPVVRLLERLQVMRAQFVAGEAAALLADGACGVREQQTHRRRRAGEVGVREIDAD